MCKKSISKYKIICHCRHPFKNIKEILDYLPFKMTKNCTSATIFQMQENVQTNFILKNILALKVNLLDMMLFYILPSAPRYAVF